MKNWFTILSLVLLTWSCRTTKHFASPKAVVETFLSASTNMDKDLLSQCFSDNSPSEWNDIRNKTSSNKDLEEIREFVADAVITKVEMKGENKAIVFVTFKSRNEKINIVKENEKWLISDF